MPTAHSEAAFLVDLVNRGLLDADGARELIAVAPDEQATLLGLAETGADRCLVLAAIRFRGQVLEQFDALLSPPVEAGPVTSEQRIVSFILECSEREARRNASL